MRSPRRGFFIRLRAPEIPERDGGSHSIFTFKMDERPLSSRRDDNGLNELAYWPPKARLASILQRRHLTLLGRNGQERRREKRRGSNSRLDCVQFSTIVLKRYLSQFNKIKLIRSVFHVFFFPNVVNFFFVLYLSYLVFTQPEVKRKQLVNLSTCSSRLSVDSTLGSILAN